MGIYNIVALAVSALSFIISIVSMLYTKRLSEDLKISKQLLGISDRIITDYKTLCEDQLRRMTAIHEEIEEFSKRLNQMAIIQNEMMDNEPGWAKDLQDAYDHFGKEIFLLNESVAKIEKQVNDLIADKENVQVIPC